MVITNASSSDIPDLVSLCCRELSGSLFVRLGKPLLTTLFSITIDSPFAFTLVAREKRGTIGLALGIVEPTPFILRLLPRALVGLLIHPALITQCCKTLVNSFILQIQQQALFFAVDHNQRKKGVGRALLMAVKKEYKKRGIKLFSIGVWNDMESFTFYQKTGGKLSQTIPFGKNKVLSYFTYDTDSS